MGHEITELAHEAHRLLSHAPELMQEAYKLKQYVREAKASGGLDPEAFRSHLDELKLALRI